MSTTTQTDRTVCHCLGIRESQIRDGIAIHGSECVRDIMQCTRAGTGCTACHRRIRAMLEESRDKGHESSAREEVLLG